VDKIRFSKSELKKQRDSLKQYRRYLPTLQLKKQQIQMEILRQHTLLQEAQKKLDTAMIEALDLGSPDAHTPGHDDGDVIDP